MIYINELIFVVYAAMSGLGVLVASRFSKEGLTAYAAAAIIFMNLFVTKQIELMGFIATASDALGISAALSFNLLRELYGSLVALHALRVSFMLLVWQTAVSMFHLAYVPAAVDTMQGHFVALLTPMPRILIASFVSYGITQAFELYLYGFLQRLMGGNYFVFRNFVTLSISQAFDTILFTFLGLSGVIASCWDVIVVSYGIKLITISISVPFVALYRYMHIESVYEV